MYACHLSEEKAKKKKKKLNEIVHITNCGRVYVGWQVYTYVCRYMSLKFTYGLLSI